MSPLRAATTGATTASASFFSAIGTPNLPMRVRAPANTINRCNSAGGKTWHVARKPHGRSASFATRCNQRQVANCSCSRIVRELPETKNGSKNGRACQLKGDVVRLVAIAAVISLMSPTIAIAKDCYRTTATAIKNQRRVLPIVLLPEKNGIKFYHCLLLWKIGGLDFLHHYNCQSDLIT